MTDFQSALRERLRKAGVIEELIERFEEHLRARGLEARGGQIIDATLVPVPKQRNTRAENEAIKQGKLPEKDGQTSQIACARRALTPAG